MIKHARKIAHFFHVVSNVRPVIWIAAYVACAPIFAVVYNLLPSGQFRIPDGAGTDFGSWLYYSIVTLTTLGFGDYTPAHGWAQAVTAIEVMCGIILLGFFLNAVGSMKSEIDVESEVEKQRRTHFAIEKEKLTNSMPMLLHNIRLFLDYCYSVTTPQSKRKMDPSGVVAYNPDFELRDMSDFLQPASLGYDRTDIPAVSRLLRISGHLSLCLDSLESKVDLTLWPDLLEQCFAFVANWQMFSATDILSEHPESLLDKQERESEGNTEQKVAGKIAAHSGKVKIHTDDPLHPVAELYYFIKENADLASELEKSLNRAASSSYQQLY